VADTDKKALTPTFIVYLNGTRFSAEQEADVKEITVTDRIDLPSSFSITLSDSLRKWTDNNDFSEGSTIKIMMGYKDDVEEVINAEITGISPLYRMNSDDQVSINGYDQLHRLHRGVKTRTFSNMSFTDIVKQIASDAGMQNDVDELGSEEQFMIQRDQTDFEYLLKIAKNYNCKVWVEDGKLYFKKLEQSNDSDVIVEWGKTLMEFKPRLSALGLISEVEVRGWSPAASVPVVGLATYNDISFKVGDGQLGNKLVEENFGNAKMYVVDDTAVDMNSVENIAKDLIRNNSMNYIRGTGKSQGNYKIKSGTLIELKELGSRFSGKYYVQSMNHKFVANEGFTTSFEVTRNTD
jgi:phage protein D